MPTIAYAHPSRLRLPAQLGAVFTVYGDEFLLMQETVDAIKLAYIRKGFDRITHYEVTKVSDWDEPTQALQNVGLFSEKSLIIVRLTVKKITTDMGQSLLKIAQFCQLQPEETAVIFCLPYLNQDQIKSAWYVALEKQGFCIKIPTIPPSEMAKWLAQRLQLQGIVVDHGEDRALMMQWLAQKTEGNLLAANQEIEKIKLLYPNSPINFTILQKSVTNVARFDIFDLGVLIFQGNLSGITRLILGLKSEGESPYLVLLRLYEELTCLLQIKQSATSQDIPIALQRQYRIYGQKQLLIKKILPNIQPSQLSDIQEQLSVIDKKFKGLTVDHSPIAALPIWHMLLDVARCFGSLCQAWGQQGSMRHFVSFPNR